jgi:hypothetical protein
VFYYFLNAGCCDVTAVPFGSCSGALIRALFRLATFCEVFVTHYLRRSQLTLDCHIQDWSVEPILFGFFKLQFDFAEYTMFWGDPVFR